MSGVATSSDEARHMAVQTLRNMGCVVVVFSPEDMPGDQATAHERFSAIARDIMYSCIASGNKMIEAQSSDTA